MPVIPVFCTRTVRADGDPQGEAGGSIAGACWKSDPASALMDFALIDSAVALEDFARRMSSDENNPGLFVFDGVGSDVVRHTMLGLRQIDSRVMAVCVDTESVSPQSGASSAEVLSGAGHPVANNPVANKPMPDSAPEVLRLGGGLSVDEIHTWIQYLVRTRQLIGRPAWQPDVAGCWPAGTSAQTRSVAVLSQSERYGSNPSSGGTERRNRPLPDNDGAWNVRNSGPPVRRLSVDKTDEEPIPAALAARRAERVAADGDRHQELRSAVVKSTPAAAAYGTSDEGRIRGRILIAEDLPSSLRLLTFLLEHAGAEVVGAADGTLAMQAFDESLLDRRPFDLILMDMVMPGIDGYACCELLRKRHYAGPIIAITARTLPHDRSLCLQAGADDYVSKPVDRNHFMRVVRHWLLRGDESAQCDDVFSCASESGVPAADSTM